MNTWKIILPTFVIFGAGILAGGFAINRIDRSKGITSQPAVPAVTANTVTPKVRNDPGSMDQRRIEFMRTVSSNLNLTAEQRVCVDTTLRESQECIEKLWKEFNPKTREVLNNCRSKIIADLTPEQKDLFNELMKRQARKPEESATKPGEGK